VISAGSGVPNPDTAHRLLSGAKLRPADVRPRDDLPRDAAYALCETAADVTRIVSEPALRRQVDALIAATPEAAWRCMEGGQPYHKLEDFFDEEIFLQLSEPMLALQMEWFDRWDVFLLGVVPEFREANFRPAGMHAFFLKTISDQLFMCSCALAHLVVAARPRQLVYFEGSGVNAFGRELFFDDEPVYRLILPACAEVYELPLVRVPRVPSAHTRARPMPSTRAMLRMLSPRHKARLRVLRSLGASGLLRRLITPATAPLLVFKQGFDVSEVARSALAQGWRCREFSEVGGTGEETHRAGGALAGVVSALWPRIAADAMFRRPFQWLGVDLWPVAEARVRSWLCDVVPEGWHAFAKARERLSAQRPVAVLASSPWGPIDQGILHAGRAVGVPTVTYQHGGFEGSCDFILHDMADLRDADYRLVYGPGVERYYEDRIARYPHSHVRVLSVGSPRLDALRGGLPPSRVAALRRLVGAGPGQPVILYVPTQYMQHRRYLGCGDNGDVPYFELQAHVVDVMREFPDLRFVYKAFPTGTQDPIIDLIAARCPNCRVVHRIALPELVWAADLHVIDVPSTGLLEALLTPKPIVVLADKRYERLHPEARALLQKRAVLAETPTDFRRQLRERLGTHDFAELASPNQEFLLAYGLHRDDGRSAERALATLRGLADSPPRIGPLDR